MTPQESAAAEPRQLGDEYFEIVQLDHFFGFGVMTKMMR
jgi:hypothetical protein